MRKSSLSGSFWQTLKKIESVLHLDSEDMAELLGTTVNRYERYCQMQRPLPFYVVMELAERLGVGFDSLMSGDIDWKCLAQTYYRDFSALPEKYQSNALSRRRTVTGILDCVEHLFGLDQRSALMRRFQVNEAMFVDPEAPINLRLSLDIAEYFYRLGGDPGILRLFGEHSVRTNRDGAMGMLMTGARTPQEAYEFLIQSILPRYVEQNYEWRILKCDRKRIRVAGIPNEPLRREMLKNPATHRLGCHIRSGFIAGAPELAGFSAFRAEKIACASDGSAWCEFDFFAPDLVRPLLPKAFRPKEPEYSHLA